jgi:hypothetical protein
MMKRKTPLLAYSEYVSHDPEHSTQVWIARLELIDTAKRVFPNFLNKLSADVFPLYCELANEGFNFDRILWVRMGLSPYDLLSSGNLKSALSKWATEFNAEAGWLLDGALRTLRFWHVAPEKRRLLAWYAMHPHLGTASTGEPFKFDCEGWETELLSWPIYRKSVRDRFEQKLLEYEHETRALAESCGLARAQRKYSPENLDWFVLYQFAGLSSTEIANRSERFNSVDQSTVLKGIKTAAKLIGWGHLRPQRGRRNRNIR